MNYKSLHEMMKLLEECKDYTEVSKKILFSSERYGDLIKNYWKAVHITIKELRTQMCMTQSEFADYIFMSLRTIQGWELGKKVPLGIRLIIIEHCGLVDFSYMYNRFVWIKDESIIQNSKLNSFPKYSLIGLEQEADEYC